MAIKSDLRDIVDALPGFAVAIHLEHGEFVGNQQFQNTLVSSGKLPEQFVEDFAERTGSAFTHELIDGQTSIEFRVGRPLAAYPDWVLVIGTELTPEKAAVSPMEMDLFAQGQRLARIGYAIEDMINDVFEASDMIWTMIGLPKPEQPVSYDIIAAKVLSPRAHAASTARRAEAIQTGESYSARLPILRADTGERRVFLFENHPQRTANGKVGAMFSVIADVTEQDRLERDLTTERGLLERAQLVGRIGYYALDVETKDVTLSTGLARLIGLPKGQTAPLESLLEKIYTPSDADAALKRISQAINTGQSIKQTITAKRLDTGERRCFRGEIIPDKDEHGVVTRLFGVAQDVTEYEDALRAVIDSEREFKRAERIGRMGHFRHDHVNQESDYSDMIYELLGIEKPTKKWFGVAHWADLFLEGEFERYEIQRAEVIARQGRLLTDTFWLRRRSDDEVRGLFSERIFEYDQNGNVKLEYGIAQDITESENARIEAAEREALFQRAQQVGEFGHFRHDYLMRESFWSDEVYEIFGVPSSSSPWFGMEHWKDSYDADDFAVYQRRKTDSILETAAELIHTTEIIRRADGTRRTIRSHHIFDYRSDGRLMSEFGIIQDITRQQAQQRADDARNLQLNRAQRMGNLGYFYNDYISRRLDWSDQMYEIFGIDDPSLDKLGTDRAAPALPPADLERFETSARAAVASNAPGFACVLNVVRPTDGAARTVSIDASIEYGDDGRLAAIFGIAQDVTDRETAERDRRTMSRALEEAQRTEALNYFASGMAHELSNMLQPALSFGALAKTMIERGETKKADDTLDKALEAINRARDITHSALAYVRQTDDAAKPVAFDEAIAQVRNVIDAATPNAIEWDIAESVCNPLLHCDVTGLLQVLLNLVRNAFEAGGQDARVTIGIQQESLALLIDVTDDGPGISPDIQDKIFDPLYTTRAKQQGTGLGLAVARGVVERWGGRLHFVSSEVQGRGARFRFAIPLATLGEITRP
ncbi:PAS domain-containing sensor histidine kinase [Litoreibacter roseus]|uniref:histidine kinase n=1 Tax=Litoreibacter roseus TaxID=2601869 RepID=A0A6N6JFW1_9RHOB|nr:PAS domain-containing sensor histidine kinase [Litoreibacter roseus]GFE64178.1 hypothetical protein KIN_12520 [Litoreibacter roseus]